MIILKKNNNINLQKENFILSLKGNWGTAKFYLPACIVVSDFEIRRQIAILEAGGEVVNETRSFDIETG